MTEFAALFPVWLAAAGALGFAVGFGVGADFRLWRRTRRPR